ncbi:proline-rich protein 19 [Liasis olivaceus]
MNLCDKGEGHGLSGLSSFHQLKVPLSEQSTGEKSVRVKRRRTRRERNYIKFGRKVTGRIPEQRPNCRDLQKMLPPFWSSQLSNCAKSTPIKGTHLAKPVIITQNRLTQHLGIFNREVKSADIERLLSPRAEHDVMEVTPIQRASGGLLGEEIESCSSLDTNQKSIPREQVECTVKNSSTLHEDSHFTVMPAAPVSVREHHPLAALQEVDAGYRPSSAPAAVKFDQQAIEAEAFQSNNSNNTMTLNDKENVPPVPAEGVELSKSTYLIKELAQDLEKLLDLKAIFPGRNLISEMRQTVINALLQQNKTIPDFSVLTVLRKEAGNCNMDAFHADSKNPDNRGQKKLYLELKSSNCSSRNSEQSVFLKRQREQEQFFLTCFSHGPIHAAVRVADERLAQREDLELFAEPEVRDQHSFFLTAAQPHSLLSSSSQCVNSARSSFAPEEQCALQAVRTARHWEQGLGEPRGRQERSEATKRVLLKKVDISKSYRQPLAAQDSFGSASLSKGPGCFLLADPQKYSYVYKLSPDQWNLREAESVPVYNLHPSQELCSSQSLDLGLRTIERVASESQTSFDVLKSIWSPKLPSKEAKLPVSQALGYSLAHRPLSSRGLNSEQGQPKEFFQLCNIISQQPHSYRQYFQQEVSAPSRHSQLKNGFSVLGKPRLYCQKVSAEQGRTSHNYQFWGLAEASEKMQGTREKGSSRPGNQVCGLERLLHLEEAQQLQVLQQLPMSYFPPSEALENGNSPLCTLQGHLLGQSSPEPWAFPRMKLY